MCLIELLGRHGQVVSIPDSSAAGREFGPWQGHDREIGHLPFCVILTKPTSQLGGNGYMAIHMSIHNASNTGDH